MSKDCLFVVVRQNQYNFHFEVIIKLFYFIHISYILDSTIVIFPFLVFVPEILAKWQLF